MPRKTAIPDFDPDTFVPKCPFTGKELSIIKLPSGKYMARGPFYYTAPYVFRRSLVFDLMSRNGKVPDFPRNAIEYVRDREPPMSSDPVADQVVAFNKAKELVDEKLEELSKRGGLR